MKETIKKLDAEYGFGLSDEEVELIARQAERASELFRALHALDLPEVPPSTGAERKHDDGK